MEVLALHRLVALVLHLEDLSFMLATQELGTVPEIRSSTAATRVLVIAGQGIFAKALCQLLSMDAELEILGDFADIAKAPIKEFEPDLIVLDVDGQVTKMEDAIAICRRDLPQVRLCLLSAQLQAEVLQRGLASGANGYIIKDVAPSELTRALKIIAAGGTYVDPRIAGELLRRRAMLKKRFHMFELTPREHEVIRLIAQGLSNKEISEQLNLSDKTVKNHVSHIFSKLNIGARSQAAVHAVRAGLI
jgi:DNA-binding NarL/FixJ family response regulator